MADHGGFRTVAYFVNWAIYGRNHQPQDLPADKLTHVLYAFANVRPESSEVFLTDPWSDTDKHYPNDSWNEPTPGPHLYGCLKQLNLLKRQHRNLKVLLSIGGWTYSSNFAPAASTPAGRKNFADTAVTLLKDCGFDGLDIDWEYPTNDREADDLVALLKACREAMDAYASAQGLGKRTFQLTVACPAGPENFIKLKVAHMNIYLDFWNLMAYDYAGSWDQRAGYQANVFTNRSNLDATPFSTQVAVDHYVSCGVAREKLVIGCPLYGRAFVGVEGSGRPGDKYSGGVGEGSWEKGVWDWKALPREGNKVDVDEACIASWSFDERTKTMVSFDDDKVVKMKAQWVKQSGLGGVMWWESSGDRKLGEGSAIEMAERCLHDKVEKRPNTISYPQSMYQNVRDGFSPQRRAKDEISD